MKKLILSLSAAVSLLAYPAFGQTISVSGNNATIAAGAFTDITLTLSITGANSISDVESVNMLLRALTADGGQSFFTLSNVTPISPFTLANNGAASSFTTAGTTGNSGYTVSNTAIDMGSNAPAGSNPVNATTGATFAFETVRFTSLGTTPTGVYHFGVSLNGHLDAQGSWIDNMASTQFDINSAPNFTITIVPEPATWSLFGLGVVGAFGLNLLRARRTIS
jgi:PEP-CTERM motif